MRIAYLASIFPKLSETFVYREILALRRQGVEVVCFSIHRPLHEPLPEEARLLVSETIYLWPPTPGLFSAALIKSLVRHPWRFLSTLSLYLRHAPRRPASIKRFLLHFLEGVYLAHLCERRQVRYLHAHFANGPSSVAMAASELSGIPFGFTCHAQDIYADPLMLDLKIQKAANALTISECNRAHLIREYPSIGKKVRVQKVAIDLSHFKPRPRPERKIPLMLAVGRLVPKKGFIHLIRACEILRRQGIRFRCWIIGGGPQMNDLRHAVLHAKLNGTVRLLNAQREVHKLMQRADLFVLPCVMDESGDRDGIPTTLMEAMAMELPVISTNISGIPELIAHEKNGLLAPPADAEALADQIRRLLDAPELRSRLGAAGRRFIDEHHNLTINTRELQDSIMNAVAAHEAIHSSKEKSHAGDLRHHLTGAQRRALYLTHH